MEQSRLKQSARFMWLIGGLGVGACAIAALRLPTARLDIRFLVMAAITLLVSSRITIRISRFTSHYSFSDTLIFLTILLYGGEAAVLLAAAEALCSSVLFSKKSATILFNGALSAVSTFVTVSTLRLLFGPAELLRSGEYSVKFVLAMSVMATVQYLVSFTMVAIASALKAEKSIWRTWVENYLWTSLTYFSGALTAGLIAKFIGQIGVSALAIMSPIVAIIFLTYRTYVKSVEAITLQAEQAERHVEELNHYIAEQERIREQFTQIEKLSALGELASGVAHDFNNTLAGILGRAQLLLRTDDPEKISRGLKIIITAAEDGAKTVKRIQDFARQRRDKDFHPLAVDQLLFDVSEITRPRWKDSAEANNIHIELELQIGCNAIVLGDDSELREVLVNMVFNAVDAMPEGGKLTLGTRKAGETVEIYVGDTGMGMDAETRSRIFDPFFTTKGKAGLGLGLAVSYGIISRHDGVVEVESEPGRGTIFRIKLPVGKSKPKVESPSAIVEPPHESVDRLVPSTKTNHTKILIVDDEQHVRELLRDILENENCEVVLAEGGTEALSTFETGKFDAVFTDIGMPGMSGWELARELRARDKKISLAVITGWGEAVASQEQKDAEVDWVVTKPFTADRVADLARKVSSRRNQRRNNPKFGVAA